MLVLGGCTWTSSMTYPIAIIRSHERRGRRGTCPDWHMEPSARAAYFPDSARPLRITWKSAAALLFFLPSPHPPFNRILVRRPLSADESNIFHCSAFEIFSADSFSWWCIICWNRYWTTGPVPAANSFKRNKCLVSPPPPFVLQLWSFVNESLHQSRPVERHSTSNFHFHNNENAVLIKWRPQSVQLATRAARWSCWPLTVATFIAITSTIATSATTLATSSHVAVKHVLAQLLHLLLSLLSLVRLLHQLQCLLHLLH